MSKSEKSKTRVEDTDEELTVGKYFGFRHKGLAVFLFFFLFLCVFIRFIRKERGAAKAAVHAQKRAPSERLGKEFIIFFSGLEEKGSYCFKNYVFDLFTMFSDCRSSDEEGPS
jgi:hypothetical protein